MAIPALGFASGIYNPGAGGGGGSPTGSQGYVQYYNTPGVFGGSNTFTTDGSSVTISTAIASAHFEMGSLDGTSKIVELNGAGTVTSWLLANSFANHFGLRARTNNGSPGTDNYGILDTDANSYQFWTAGTCKGEATANGFGWSSGTGCGAPGGVFDGQDISGAAGSGGLFQESGTTTGSGTFYGMRAINTLSGIAGGNPTGIAGYFSATNGKTNFGLYVAAGQVQINSSMTVAGPGGIVDTYGLSVGSMTGAGLSSCSGASNAVTWNSGTSLFGCNSGFLTGNQSITLSGDATGSGTTAITVTAGDNQPNIKTLAASSVTVQGILAVSGFTQHASTITVPTSQGFTKGTLGVSWDGGGSALTAGTTYWLAVPSTGTITGFRFTLSPAGTASVSVSSSTVFDVTKAGRICASDCPTLTSGSAQTNDAISGWTTAVAQDGYLWFVINAAGLATATQANLSVKYNKL